MIFVWKDLNFYLFYTFFKLSDWKILDYRITQTSDILRFVRKNVFMFLCQNIQEYDYILN
jgi:hypothetical protein